MHTYILYFNVEQFNPCDFKEANYFICTPEFTIKVFVFSPRQSIKEVALETFKKMDTDNSGQVSFIEFKVAMEKQGGQKLSLQAMKDFFNSFDKDKDGQLSLQEIESLVA